MRAVLKNTRPVLAPLYIYWLLAALIPVCMVIDLFVAPSIYWPNVYTVPVMVAIYTSYLVFLAKITGPLETAPLWAKGARIICECLLLLTLTRNCLPLLDQMVKINQWPLADDWLAAADAFIGFDWLAYFTFVHERPDLIWLLDYSYMITGQIAFFLVCGLILMGQLRRIRFHMETVVLTTFISILVSAVTPAYAAAIYYGIDFSEYPNFGFAPGIYHVENLYLLREASPDYGIGEQPFKGLVTFPSVHTALGVLLAGAVWRHWLFWPLAAYAVVMIPSTPVFGSHYIVDVFAGAALSIAVMMIVARRKAYAGLFDAKPVSEPNWIWAPNRSTA
ncbi:MAG: phosphatase PAP2 family protein [Paracoccaceae bacterium]|nr:phosphatase PAP2 family protein [Paracoccaceae bacterium]